MAGRAGKQLDDEQYYSGLCKLAGDLRITEVIIDPSAASMIAAIRNHGKFAVKPADNTVGDGIRRVATHLNKGDLLFCECCRDSLREFSVYSWDPKAAEDRPLKQNDHAMDDIRYFVNTILEGQPVARIVNNPYMRR